MCGTADAEPNLCTHAIANNEPDDESNTRTHAGVPAW